MDRPQELTDNPEEIHGTVKILTDPAIGLAGAAQANAGEPAAVESRAVSSTSQQSLVGQTIASHYIIESLIGSGGMSVVYKARHLILNQVVAVKMLHSHLAKDEHAISRFKQEAQLASRLDHAGIVGLRDFGVLESGQAYLIMDFVPGRSLAEIIAHEKLSPKRSLSFCAKICAALSHAHEKGVIHRDIKPSNVIVVNEGLDDEDIKLLDFGIAKIVWDEHSGAAKERLTHTGESLGSPPYMSPEQCQGMPLDARSDVYSTGCLLYELLTGKPPFRGGTLFATIHMQITAMPDSIAKTRKDISHVEKLDELILKAMDKDPDERYQTIQEFGEAATSTLAAYDKFGALSKFITRCNVLMTRARSQKRNITTALVTMGLALSVVSLAWQLQQTSHQQQTPAVDAALAPVIKGADAFDQYFRQGNTLFDMEDYSKAKAEFSNAVWRSDAVGEASDAYQQCLDKLATCCEKTDEPAQAAPLRQRLAQIKRFCKPLGTIDSNNAEISSLSLKQTEESRKKLADVLTNQATLYLLQHNSALALKTAAAAYDTSKTAWGAEHAHTGEALSLLIAANTEEGKRSSAEKLLPELFSVAEHNKNVEPALLPLAYLRAGRLHGVEGSDALFDTRAGRDPAIYRPLNSQSREQINKGIAELNKAIDLYTQLYNGPSPYLADALTQLGNMETFLGNWQTAQQALDRALATNTTIHGADSPLNPKIHYYLARLLTYRATSSSVSAEEKRSLLLQADQNLEQAEVVFQKLSSDEESSAQLGEVLNFRGYIYSQLGDLTNAEKLYKASINIAARWNAECWTAGVAYQRLIKMYQSSNLPERIKDQKIASLMQMVQKYASVPKNKLKPQNDLNKPITDNES